jgi:hypothetical protein
MTISNAHSLYAFHAHVSAASPHSSSLALAKLNCTFPNQLYFLPHLQSISIQIWPFFLMCVFTLCVPIMSLSVTMSIFFLLVYSVFALYSIPYILCMCACVCECEFVLSFNKYHNGILFVCLWDVIYSTTTTA